MGAGDDAALRQSDPVRCWPTSSHGSWSMSPTIKRAAVSGTAFISDCISMTSSLPRASKPLKDWGDFRLSRGLVVFHTNSFATTMAV